MSIPDGQIKELNYGAEYAINIYHNKDKENHEYDLRACAKCSEFFDIFQLKFNNFNYRTISSVLAIYRFISDFVDKHELKKLEEKIVKKRLKSRVKPCCLFHMVSWHVCGGCFSVGLLTEACKYSSRMNDYNIKRTVSLKNISGETKKSLITLLLAKQEVLKKIIDSKDKSDKEILDFLTKEEKEVLNIFYSNNE